MSVTSINRDTNNNVSLVRMIVTDTLSQVATASYIKNNQTAINNLNGGTWTWFNSDMLVIAASDGNAIFTFTDSTFSSLNEYSGGSSGVVSPGLINQLAWYAASGSTISGLTTANNGVLFTSGGGVPSIGTAPVVAGGTGVTSVTTSPTASSWAGWNANKNMSANSFIPAYTTTPTAAATTTLTVASTYQQYFTGATTQTVLMPVTSTLVLGQPYFIVNNSSGVVTVQSSGGNTIQAMAANTTLLVTCILTSGTTAASWYADYNFQNALTLPLSLANGGTAASLTASNGGLLYSTASTLAILSGTATANQIPLSGSNAAPTWSTATYPATTTINQLLYSSAANTITGLATAAAAVLTTVASVPAWAATLSVALGGTGVASVTTVPAATAWAGWDANKNMSANSFISGYTTTVTAAATTTLLVGSTYQQFFTGSTTQTVILPVTSTLVLGQPFFIVNNSSGIVTVQSSGANTIQAMAANTTLLVTCILTSGTTAASWYADYNLQNALTLPLSLANGGTNASLTASNGGIFYSTATAGAILSGTATANQVLLSGSSAAPAWSTATYPATTTINQVLYSSSANVIGGISAVNSAVMISSAGGVPSFSTTLPSGLTIPGYQTSLTLPLSLANGGTNANLTASNGGIFYSTASAGAILAGTATAGQLLTSGASTTPAWTTSTYPATNAINTLLYASSANVMAALATANNGVLFTSAGGVPSIGTAPVVAGGTGVTSVTIAPAATAWAGWDANKNMSANAFIQGYTTTATAAGTTTLTVGSTGQQYFTGSTTQTVTLPVTSTLVLGQGYYIVNNSSGVVTVQSSGANSVKAMAASSALFVRCILTSGTTAASWDATGYIVASGGSNPWSAGAGTGSAIGGDGTATAAGNYALAYGNTSTQAAAINSFAFGTAMQIGASSHYSMMFGNGGGQGGNCSYSLNFGLGNSSTNNQFGFSFGNGCTSTGNYAWSAGNGATANNAGSFVWADSTGTSNASSASNQWILNYNGGYYFYSGTNNATIVFQALSTGCKMIGTNTNDSAASTYVGEIISSVIASGSAITPSQNVATNLTSVSLTAGDWDVWANGFFASLVATSSQYVGISTTSATLPDNSLLGAGTASTAGTSGGFMSQRISISTTTTVYAVVFNNGATGTACGGIYARRVR